MLYICDVISPRPLSIMDQYCRKGHYCAIINVFSLISQEDVEVGEKIREFIGAYYEQYYAILSSQGKKKYVLPITE